MSSDRARGQPLLVLALILSGWVGVRAATWNLMPDSPEVALAQELTRPDAVDHEEWHPLAPPAVQQVSEPAAVRASPAHPAALPTWQPQPPREPFMAPVTPLPVTPSPIMAEPAPAAVPLAAAAPTEAQRWIMVAGGHQLLALAATAMLPMPADIAARFAAPAPPGQRRAAALPRWSGDAWLFLRHGAPAPITFPRLTGSGAYGASQAGAVLRYRLAPADPHRPTVYLRGATALGATRQQEAALGLSARPLSGVPVAAMAEVRAIRDAQGTRAVPAAALVTELPPQRLPFGFSGEAYVQAGYVGGRAPTAFVDGLVRAERPVAEVHGFDLRAGAGAWGARQRGAGRCRAGGQHAPASGRYCLCPDRGGLALPHRGRRQPRLGAGAYAFGRVLGRLVEPQPLGEALGRYVVEAQMVDREAEFGIGHAPPVRVRIRERHDQQPARHLLSPVHPRGVFLPDVAALGEAHSVELGRIAFQPQRLPVAEFGAAFGDAEAQAVCPPGFVGALGVVGIGRGDPAFAQGGEPRVWRGAVADVSTPVHRNATIDADRDLAPQPVQREAANERVGGLGLAIEQQVIAGRPDQEVEQRLALRRQQPAPDGQDPGHVIRDETLEKSGGILAGFGRNADDGTREQAGGGHGQGGLVRSGQLGKLRQGNGTLRAVVPHVPGIGRAAQGN